MHRSRQWIILTLLGLVGLGPIGSGELLAQTVEGVTIKKGGTVGIDGVFQVDVTVQDFDEDPTLEVAVFLVALEKNSDGDVTDTLIVESGWDNDVRNKERVDQHSANFGGGSASAFLDGAFGTSSSIAPFVAGTTTLITESVSDGGTEANPVRASAYAASDGANNPFAAFRTADRGTDRNDIPEEGDTPTAEADRKWVGDADSLFITGTGVDDSKIAESKHKNIAVDTRYLIRWYSTANEIMGEHDEVYAAAVVRDGTAYSSIVLSDNSMKIDGDRPVQGTYLHFARPYKTSDFGFKVDDAETPGGAEVDDGDDATEDTDTDGISLAADRDEGEYHPVDLAGLEYAKELKGAALRVATGFTALEGVTVGADGASPEAVTLVGAGGSPTDRIVLGIQDTLIAYIQLNDLEYGNIRTNLQQDWSIVVKAGGKVSTADASGYFEKSDGSRKTILQHKDAIAENEYGDLSDSPLVLTAYIQDGAGNTAASYSIDGDGEPAASVTTAILVDGVKPSLASRAAGTGVTEIKNGGATIIAGLKPVDDGGDTLVAAPLGGDRISGGEPNRDVDLPADENPPVYVPNETLGQLNLTLKSRLADRPDVVVEIKSEGSSEDAKALDFSYAGLKTDSRIAIDLSKMIAAGPAGDIDANDIVEIWKDKGGDNAGTFDAAGSFTVARKEGFEGALLADGKTDYVFEFVATDIAGNVGAKETRSGVTLDLKDIGFTHKFPIMDGSDNDLRTLGAASANVSVELNKDADTLAVIYKHLGPGDADASKNDTLTIGGDGLAKDTFTELSVTGLEDGKMYYVRIDARDGAGNWTQAGPDTFTFDEDHELVPAENFKVTIAGQSDKSDQFKLRGFKDDNKDDLDDDKMLMINAGKVVLITLQAQTEDDKTAFLYREEATLTVIGGQGVDLVEKSSPGASQPDGGGNVINLDDDGWGSDGKRTVAIRDTVSDGKLVFSLQGGSVDGAFELRDTVLVQDDAYARLIVSGPADPVTRGEDFTVEVSIADSFGNVREKDSRFVNVTANQIGAVVPAGDVPIRDGTGSFIANSGSATSFTTMVVTVRDIVQQGDTFIHGVSGVINVEGDPVDPGRPPVGPPVEEIDAPDTLIAEDYRGALGDGDQGGFVLLTFDPSDNHDIIDGYRIYRQIAVTHVLGEDGSIVQEEDATAFIPWAFIDAVPDPGLMRAVVATLDSDATPFEVAAEYVVPASKQAFMPGMSLSNPYEMMAQTMAKSRESAVQPKASDGPLFATLTPEAVAFATKGIAPLMKAVDNVYLSERVRSEAVRAIDNIPPGAIPYMKVLDTPGDAGGSITVSWAKSPDDHMVTTSVGQAVGGQVYTTAGVKGYKVYRKIGDAAYEVVGEAPGGSTSFEDEMVFNGIRYTYQVRPFDEDNIGETILEKTAMAIRNRVFDSNGKAVFGLFGADNQVGFDDFFILADQFGLTAEDETFEPAFDLSPNNKIDLNDFFTFADFFGREIEGVGKTLPGFLAGLNSDARFYLDTGLELPRVGEEMAIAVSLQDFAELKGYGLSVSYDPQLLSFVGTEVENSILGTGEFAEGHVVANKDGLVSLVAYGDVGTEGDLGLNLVFRSLREIEDSYIEILNGELRDGNYGLNSLDTPVSVRIQTRPEVYALRNNYPNPFNPETTLKYDLPDAGDVKLEVYNMLGQVVRTLVNERQTAGRYAVQWDATNDRGQSMSSGIYFYRVQVGGEFTDVKKMLLLK